MTKTLRTACIKVGSTLGAYGLTLWAIVLIVVGSVLHLSKEIQ